VSDPEKFVDCANHGRGSAAFVCGHLAAGSRAGFYAAGGSGDPRPDAWCQRCEEVRLAEGGEWNRAAAAFLGVKLICAGCYDAVREKNERVADVAVATRFTCESCGERHAGLPRDFAFDAPKPWGALSPAERSSAVLTSDVCEIGDDRFVRACLEIPVLRSAGPLVYGVWVSLSARNYAEFVAHADELRRYRDGPYFGWFCNSIPGYPETALLKTNVHVRPPPLRPVVILEPTDHPLALDQRAGITQERFRSIAFQLMHVHGASTQ
jgi:hypothetical protein